MATASLSSAATASFNDEYNLHHGEGEGSSSRSTMTMTLRQGKVHVHGATVLMDFGGK